VRVLEVQLLAPEIVAPERQQRAVWHDVVVRDDGEAVVEDKLARGTVEVAGEPDRRAEEHHPAGARAVGLWHAPLSQRLRRRHFPERRTRSVWRHTRRAVREEATLLFIGHHSGSNKITATTTNPN
jgi:hypothetical protein